MCAQGPRRIWVFLAFKPLGRAQQFRTKSEVAVITMVSPLAKIVYIHENIFLDKYNSLYRKDQDLPVVKFLAFQQQ